MPAFTIDLVLSASKLVLRFIMLILACVVYAQMHENAGTALREGDDVDAFTACFIFDYRSFNVNVTWGVGVDFGYNDSAAHEFSIEFNSASKLQQNCAFWGNPAWSRTGTLTSLMDETQVGDYMIWALLALVLTWMVEVGMLVVEGATGLMDELTIFGKVLKGFIETFLMFLTGAMYKPFAMLRREDNVMWIW